MLLYYDCATARKQFCKGDFIERLIEIHNMKAVFNSKNVSEALSVRKEVAAALVQHLWHARCQAMVMKYLVYRGGFFHSPFAFCEENYDFANIIKDRVRHFGECCHKSEMICDFWLFRHPANT